MRQNQPESPGLDQNPNPFFRNDILMNLYKNNINLLAFLSCIFSTTSFAITKEEIATQAATCVNNFKINAMLPYQCNHINSTEDSDVLRLSLNNLEFYIKIYTSEELATKALNNWQYFYQQEDPALLVPISDIKLNHYIVMPAVPGSQAANNAVACNLAKKLYEKGLFHTDFYQTKPVIYYNYANVYFETEDKINPIDPEAFSFKPEGLAGKHWEIDVKAKLAGCLK